MTAMFELARPDASTQEASSRLEQAVGQAVESQRHSVTLVVGTDEGTERLEVPRAVLDALLRTVHEQAEGHRVRIIAPDAKTELTPNEAANYLGISRPLLLKLLDKGTIPARNKPGSSHRMIAVVDLDAYRDSKDRRRARLSEAMNDVAEEGLYMPQR